MADGKGSAESLQDVQRLLQQQELAIEECRTNLENWKKMKADYEALLGRLTTLPEKLSYDLMIPFCGVALMPGRLVHTNEILVSLGDSWFAERSAKDAGGIAARRIKYVSERLAEFEQEVADIEAQRQMTLQLLNEKEDFVEIREPYDTENDETLVERRRRREKENQELLARIEKQVEVLSDSGSTSDDDEEDEDDDEDDDDSEEEVSASRIIVHHSEPSEAAESAEARDGDDAADISQVSPGRFLDMYRKVLQPASKKETEEKEKRKSESSRTKKSVHFAPDTKSEPAKAKEKTAAKSRAFSGVIVEKGSSMQQHPTPSYKQQQKRISRFKASRKGNDASSN